MGVFGLAVSSTTLPSGPRTVAAISMPACSMGADTYSP